MFREDLESAFTLEAVEACIVKGRDELPASSLISYKAFIDPSGGKKDAFTVGIGHKESERAVLDCLKIWPAPFDPAVVVEEAAEALKAYGCVSVTGDNYAGEWPVSYFRQRGIDYQKSEKAKSELYLAMIPAVNGKQVELLDNRQMVEELRRLERRRGRTGKDAVDHPANGHDDIANAAAGACWLILNEGSGDEILGGFQSTRHVAKESFTVAQNTTIYVGLTLTGPFASVVAQKAKGGVVQVLFALVSPSLHSHLRDLREWLNRYARGSRYAVSPDRIGIYEDIDSPGLIEQIEDVIQISWEKTFTEYEPRRQQLLKFFDEFTPVGQPKLQIGKDVILLPEALARPHIKGTPLFSLENAAGLLIDRMAPGQMPTNDTYQVATNWDRESDQPSRFSPHYLGT